MTLLCYASAGGADNVTRVKSYGEQGSPATLNACSVEIDTDPLYTKPITFAWGGNRTHYLNNMETTNQVSGAVMTDDFNKNRLPMIGSHSTASWAAVGSAARGTGGNGGSTIYQNLYDRGVEIKNWQDAHRGQGKWGATFAWTYDHEQNDDGAGADWLSGMRNIIEIWKEAGVVLWDGENNFATTTEGLMPGICLKAGRFADPDDIFEFWPNTGTGDAAWADQNLVFYAPDMYNGSANLAYWPPATLFDPLRTRMQAKAASQAALGRPYLQMYYEHACAELSHFTNGAGGNPGSWSSVYGSTPYTKAFWMAEAADYLEEQWPDLAALVYWDVNAALNTGQGAVGATNYLDSSLAAWESFVSNWANSPNFTSANDPLPQAGGGGTVTETHSTSAIIKKTMTKVQSGNSIVKKTATRTHDTSAYIVARASVSQSVSAIIKVTPLRVQSASAIVKKTATRTHSTSAIIRMTSTLAQASDAQVSGSPTQSQSSSAIIKKTATRTGSSDADVRKTASLGQSSAAVVKKTLSLIQAASASIKKTATRGQASDVFIRSTRSVSQAADANVESGTTRGQSADALVLRFSWSAAASDAVVEKTESQAHSSDAVVERAIETPNLLLNGGNNVDAISYSVPLLRTPTAGTYVLAAVDFSRSGGTPTPPGSVFVAGVQLNLIVSHNYKTTGSQITLAVYGGVGQWSGTTFSVSGFGYTASGIRYTVVEYPDVKISNGGADAIVQFAKNAAGVVVPLNTAGTVSLASGTPLNSLSRTFLAASYNGTSDLAPSAARWTELADGTQLLPSQTLETQYTDSTFEQTGGAANTSGISAQMGLIILELAAAPFVEMASQTSDAVIRKVLTVTHSADASVRDSGNPIQRVDAIISKPSLKAQSVNAHILKKGLLVQGSDAYVVAQHPDITQSADAIIIIWGPPQELTATGISATEIDLEWNPSLGATEYDIERDGVIIVRGHTDTLYHDTGLVYGTVYTYRVRAVR